MINEKNQNLEGSRFSKLMMNTGTSVVLKLAAFVCSFILTRLIIGSYGSEINGLIGSITQFLGLITLLEGGIGGVARAVLYKPLAEKNRIQVQKIIKYLERFFRILALAFVGYAFVIAFIFPSFTEKFDFLFSFTLVLILAISNFCEYFFAMSYHILLAADQKSYVSNSINLVVTILNFGFAVLLIKLGLPIHIVKMVSVFILLLKPIITFVYCRKKYGVFKYKLDKSENLIPQKWDGLGVHVSYFLHRNTDTILITIFLSLSLVSVYSVYNLVIGGILAILEAFSIGVEASFGDMYAKGEIDTLKDSFKKFVFYYQFLSTILLGPTLVLIVPFVSVYTKGICDVNYIQPLFGTILVIAEIIYTLRVPFNSLMVATNSFKEIKIGAYGEVIINVVTSIALLFPLGLTGVAIGTLLAMLFRLIHFIYFFSRKKINLEFNWFFKTTLLNIVVIGVLYAISLFINFDVNGSYLLWIAYGAVVFATFVLLTFLFQFGFNKKQIAGFITFVKNKVKKL